MYKFTGPVKGVSAGRELWCEGRRGEGGDRSLSDENSLGLADYHLWQTGEQHRRWGENPPNKSNN